MREILFRGKCIGYKEWIKDGEWVQGLPMYTANKSEKGKIDRILTLRDGYYSILLVDPETVCQYTNSIALGGDKIFEHDIVEEDGAIGIVKFGKYGNGFHIGYYIDWINFPHLRNELHFWDGRVRIIGNIFDNPELVERGKVNEQ